MRDCKNACSATAGTRRRRITSTPGRHNSSPLRQPCWTWPVWVQASDLDIACGTGLVTFRAAMLAAPGGDVVGTDISDEMIGAARGMARAEGVTNCSFERMDAEALAFCRRFFRCCLVRTGPHVRARSRESGRRNAPRLEARRACSLRRMGRAPQMRLGRHLSYRRCARAVGRVSDVLPARDGRGAVACVPVGRFWRDRLPAPGTLLQYADGTSACEAAFVAAGRPRLQPFHGAGEGRGAQGISTNSSRGLAPGRRLRGAGGVRDRRRNEVKRRSPDVKSASTRRTGTSPARIPR